MKSYEFWKIWFPRWRLRMAAYCSVKPTNLFNVRTVWSNSLICLSSSSSSFISKTSIFPSSARVRRSSRNEPPPHIPEHSSFSMQTNVNYIHTYMQSKAPSYPSSHIDTKSSSLYSHLSPLPPLLFYRLTPNHPHSYAPHYQTTLIYFASPPPRRSVHQKDCTNPHCVSYSSAKLRTSISPSSVPLSTNFADTLPSSPRFQSHMSVDSGHKLCISFPLCGMMHPLRQNKR